MYVCFTPSNISFSTSFIYRYVFPEVLGFDLPVIDYGFKPTELRKFCGSFYTLLVIRKLKFRFLFLNNYESSFSF